MVPKLTAQGYNLLVNAIDGTGLNFTKIKIGNGDAPDDFLSLNDIVNPIVSIGITTITKEDKYVVLRAPMSNSNYDSGFEMAEMGVFVANPDGGEDILYAYAHYKLSGDAAAVYVPPVTSNLVEITHNIHVYIGELDNVTAILAESSEYALAKDLSDHLTDTGNPHNVGKKEVGLENVPNVTPENQQPVFSNTITEVTTGSSGNKNLPNISNGEKMGSILQKIRSAIAAFVSHINAKNPHGMDAETIGAAAKSHQHSANDINKGTLGLTRGGTGATNAAAARSNLDITPTNIGAVPNTGGDVSGYLNFGEGTRGLKWKTSNGTEIMLRPDYTSNLFQIVKKGANDSAWSSLLNILTDGTPRFPSKPLEIGSGGTGAASASESLLNLMARGSKTSTPTAIGDLTDPGLYWVSLSNCTGGPESSGFGWLEVGKSDKTDLTFQRYTSYSSGATYENTYVNGRWYGWKSPTDAYDDMATAYREGVQSA